MNNKRAQELDKLCGTITEALAQVEKIAKEELKESVSLEGVDPVQAEKINSHAYEINEGVSCIFAGRERILNVVYGFES